MDIFAVGVMIYIFAFAQPVGGYDDGFGGVLQEFKYVGKESELARRLSSNDPKKIVLWLMERLEGSEEEERDAINCDINCGRAKLVARKVEEVLGAASPSEPSNESLRALGDIAKAACSEVDANRPSAIIAYQTLLAALAKQCDQALDKRDAVETPAAAAVDAEATEGDTVENAESEEEFETDEDAESEEEVETDEDAKAPKQNTSKKHDSRSPPRSPFTNLGNRR